MDIIEELKFIKEAGVTSQSAFKKMNDDLSKKLYLLKVLEVADAVEKVVKSKVLEQYGCKYINIYFGNEDHVSFHFMDGNGRVSVSKSKNQSFEHTNLSELFKLFENFSENKKYLSGENGKGLELKEDVREKIINLLLNDELKKTLEYSQIHAEMLDKDELYNKVKKHKI